MWKPKPKTVLAGSIAGLVLVAMVALLEHQLRVPVAFVAGALLTKTIYVASNL
jgi:hypothetical protein